MIVVPKEAYPLQWPAGVRRTPWPQNSSFEGAANGREIARIRKELRLAGARTIVISSNLPIKDDGMPYSIGTQNPNGDAAAVVYWTRQEKHGKTWHLVPYCMPCDKWKRLADNLHAIALSIGAMRGMERWGAVSVEQAFAGFAALPPGGGEEVVPHQPEVDWRAVLGGSWPDLEASELLAVAKARHRKLIVEAHPDAGGDNEQAVTLNAALAAAEQELRPS